MKTYIQPVVKVIGMNTESLIALSGPHDEVGGIEMTRQKHAWSAESWSDDEEELVEE